MKKVSIVLPTYNGERFIKESIDSILNQTYTNWELIIVNDCSTDNTLDIINDYLSKDSRIKLISNEQNKKLPASLNIGFANATGDYYTWTSDDNKYKPTAIEEMVDFLDKNPQTDLVSFNFNFIHEDGTFDVTYTEIVPSRAQYVLAIHCNIGACFMYRKEIAQKVGEYDTNMFCAEDYDYWCRIALNGNISYQDKILYDYRNNSQSLTATKLEIVKQKTEEIQRKYSIKILEHLGFNKNEQVKYFYDRYQLTSDKIYMEFAQMIDKKLLQYFDHIRKISTFIKNIFSIEN